jgi:hypothetical protein
MTGVGDHDAQQITNVGERVFAADLNAVVGGWEAEEPGIFIEAGSLPDNTQVGFTITRAVRYWDGTGAVNFDTIASVPLSLEFGPNSVQTPGTDTEVNGFTIAYDADAPGGFDEHWDFLLADPAPTGIYLLELRFSLSGFLDSDTTWTVLNAGLDEAVHDEAIEWAEANIPTPGALALLALGGVTAGRRRR